MEKYHGQRLPFWMKEKYKTNTQVTLKTRFETTRQKTHTKDRIYLKKTLYWTSKIKGKENKGKRIRLVFFFKENIYTEKVHSKFKSTLLLTFKYRDLSLVKIEKTKKYNEIIHKKQTIPTSLGCHFVLRMRHPEWRWFSVSIAMSIN